MNNETPPTAPAAEVVRAAAASWLLRRRDFDVWTEDDEHAFDAWQSETVAHRIAYLRLEAVWQDADRLTVLRQGPKRRVLSLLRDAAPKSARFIAALAVISGLGIANSFYFSAPAVLSYATAVGERKIVKLADGSRIELNTDTSIRLSMSGRERRVALLTGEAFFQIAHNANRPFVVDAGNYRVTDLGTQFAVRRSARRLQVDLVEGSARFESSDGGQRSAVLKPGDTIVATVDSFSIRKKPVDVVSDALGWRRGMLVFHHTPLSDVIAEFNRYNTQKMAIADPSVAGRTITATLPTNDITAFKRIAIEFFGLHVSRRGDDILITR